MTVDDELDFLFSLGDKVSEGTRLWLRESLITGPVVSAKLSVIRRIQRLPVNAVITIEIGSNVFLLAGALELWIVVLSLVENFLFSVPMTLNSCRSICVNYWNKIEDVILKHVSILSHILYVALVNQL